MVLHLQVGTYTENSRITVIDLSQAFLNLELWVPPLFKVKVNGYTFRGSNSSIIIFASILK